MLGSASDMLGRVRASFIRLHGMSIEAGLGIEISADSAGRSQRLRAFAHRLIVRRQRRRHV